MNQRDAQGGPSGRERSDVDCGLSRDQRVPRSNLFREAFDKSPGFRGRFLVLWWRENGETVTRLGVVASKRSFRRAVDRARAKRLLREAFRLNRHRLKIGVDVILVARYTILNVKRQPVDVDLLAVAHRAGILGESVTGRE